MIRKFIFGLLFVTRAVNASTELIDETGRQVETILQVLAKKFYQFQQTANPKNPDQFHLPAHRQAMLEPKPTFGPDDVLWFFENFVKESDARSKARQPDFKLGVPNDFYWVLFAASAAAQISPFKEENTLYFQQQNPTPMTIPRCFLQFTYLKTLFIEKANFLTQDFTNFTYFPPTLETLKVLNCKFKTLPSLRNCNMLQVLDVSDCTCEKEPLLVPFNNFLTLKELTLENNKTLESQGKEKFKAPYFEAINLKTLSLDGHDLSVDCSHLNWALLSIKGLEILSLQQCRLSPSTNLRLKSQKKSLKKLYIGSNFGLKRNIPPIWELDSFLKLERDEGDS